MKNIICGMLAIFIATLIAAAMPTEAEARIYEDTIRLHILAASDSEEDQALKLDIRDRLLKKYGGILSSYSDIDSASKKITELLPSIEADLGEWVKGAGYGASAELCYERYDTREYESYTLPKGTYLSLKIRLGEAEGKNWWCVMFPPLCLDVATEPTYKKDTVDNGASYTEEETTLITSGKYNIKFKLLELFSWLF